MKRKVIIIMIYYQFIQNKNGTGKIKIFDFYFAPTL